MATAWAAWFDAVLPECPGAPQPLATNAIRESAIDFFKAARCWTEVSDPINAVANQAEYAFAKSGLSNIAVVDWLQVLWHGSGLDDLSRGHLDQYPSWATLQGPFGYLSLNPQKVRLIGYPTANEANAIKMIAILRPSRTATGVSDDNMAEEYFDTIACGAKQRIQRIPGMPYTNLEAASMNLELFNQGAGKANVDSTFGRNQSELVAVTRFY